MRQTHLPRLAAVALVSLFATIATRCVAADRPNLLWLSCEDISPHVGCYGDPHARTPHIDRLATSGVRYQNAFATAGVCAPCRSSIITGMYQTTLGTHHMRCQAKLPQAIRPFTVYLRRAGYYCTNNSKKDYQFREPRGTWDESSRKAHWRKRPRPDQPFFSVFNFTECHESGIASDGKYARVTEGIERQDPAKLTTLPPYYPDTPVARADWARYYDVIAAMDRRVGQVLTELEKDGLADDTIVVFWSDHGVGLPRAKRWLYDSGIRVPLIVRVPPKWRALAPGNAGSVSKRLVSLMDLGPTMLRLAGVPLPSHMQGRPFFGSDLPPPRRYIYAARDRMDERYDIIRAVRDERFKYIRNYEPLKTYYQYMNTPEKGRLMREIRKQHALGKLPPAAAQLMADRKPVEELYDTQVDPHEIRNLAADPKFASDLKRLRQAHLQWVLDSRDVGLIPEPILAEREQQLGSRYAILQGKQAAAKLAQLRDAASTALAGPSEFQAMLRNMQAADAAVRYWGAIGVGNLGRQGAPAAEQLKKLLEDDSRTVRVAAARALCRQDQAVAALPVLVDVLQNGQQWERLHAIIVLDEIDGRARPVLDAMKSALKYRSNLVARGKYTVRVANRALNELLGTSRTVP